MRQIIKKDHVRVDEQGAPTPTGGRRAGASPTSVEVVRVDGRVQVLEVRCACGEVSVIELTYGDAASPEETAS